MQREQETPRLAWREQGTPGMPAAARRPRQGTDSESGAMPERGTAQAVAHELGLGSPGTPRPQHPGAISRGWRSISEQNRTSCEE